MIQLSIADIVLFYITTIFTIDNLHKLGYGTVEIIDLFSNIDIKIRIKEGLKQLIGNEADKFIK